jgi:MGT family glycosyltransferase
MTARRDVLFTIWEGGGNVPPQLSVARALVARGHRVRVLADAILRTEVEATGAEHVAWTRAPQRTTWDPSGAILRDWEARTPIGALARLRDTIVTGYAAEFASDVLSEIERRRPDVVARDFLLPGVHAAVEASGVASVVLVHSLVGLPEWGVPPLGPGFKPARGRLGRARDTAFGAMNRRLFDKGLPTLNAARAGLGLARVDSVFTEMLAADRGLLLYSRAFEFPQCRPPERFVFAGPRLADPAWAGEWTPPPGDEPLVLVGLSTTFMDQLDLLRRIASALGTLPVRGLMTTGPTVRAEAIEAPANVTVVKAAPHSQVLRHAAAAVTHGGHGTLIKALAAGVPVVALPMGRDQADNATRLEATGAGVRVRPGARASKISGAVGSVLGDPRFAHAARRVARGIADELRSDRTVAEIEALAQARPAERRPAAPRDRTGRRAWL